MVCTLKHLSLYPEMEALYLFNPENDMALACGDPYYMAPASARRMAAELSALPAWYARQGGTVWIDSPQRAKIIKKQFPLSLPVNWVSEFSPIYNKVCPWGWNPSLVRRLQEAGFPAAAYPSAERMARIRQLSGRQTAAKVLRNLRRSGPMCGKNSTVGEAFVLSSVEEVERFVLSRPRALLKAPWSGSGRGIQYTSGIFPAPLKGWVQHVLTTQHEVVGEPLYDKLLDFAMEFFADDRGQVRFVGYSLFETDKRGIYKENWLASDADIEARLASYVPKESLRQICRALLMELMEVIKGDYQGYLGVDMMVCRTSDGGYTIHPCVEINLRMNMGVVARLLYDQYVCSGVQGRYIIEYYAKPGEAWRSHLAFQERYPLHIEDGRVKSGYLSLTPIEENTTYQAYIII